jgi:very-long-chain enoyl-CoA reductase
MGAYALPAGATAGDLMGAIAAAKPALYADRQRLYRPVADAGKRPAALAAGDKLADGEGLLFKDLGPQISWKWVFVVEYLGPLLLYPLFFLQPTWIYGDVAGAGDAWAREVQLTALYAWTVHYAKRELETLFVHRFSHATMPVGNLLKNCSYYWGFAAYVSYFVNHPLYTPPPPDLVYSGTCLFYFMEVGNFTCHWTLRQLRPPGTRVRAIPTGGLFDYVTSPNYTYEIMAWVGFNLMTRTVAGVLFMCAGATQMFIWARGKHRNYVREFDGKDGRGLYPEARKIIVPFVY